MEEAKIQKDILNLLNSCGILAWRNSVGNRGYKKFGKKGQADISGLIKKQGGRRLEIEVKKEIGGKVSKQQTEFIEMINYHGGIAFVARSVSDVKEKLGL